MNNIEEKEIKIDFLKRRLQLYLDARLLTRQDFETHKKMGYEIYKSKVLNNDSFYTIEEFNDMLIHECTTILDLDRMINSVRYDLLKLGEIEY